MNESDRMRFSSLVNRLCITFRQDMTAELVDIYYKALKHLPINRIATAVDKACAEAQWFPKPVELADFAREPERYESVPDTCELCHGCGIRIRNESVGMMGSPCKCTAGRNVLSAWQANGTEYTASKNRDRMREVENAK